MTSMPSSENQLGPRSAQTGNIDAVLAEFDNIPLFMKSLPEDDSENVALSALQSLAHEGTPDGG